MVYGKAEIAAFDHDFPHLEKEELFHTESMMLIKTQPIFVLEQAMIPVNLCVIRSRNGGLKPGTMITQA